LKKSYQFDHDRFTELKIESQERSLTPTERIEFRTLSLRRKELMLGKERVALHDQVRRHEKGRKIKLGELVIAAGLGEMDGLELRGALAEILIRMKKSSHQDSEILLGRWRALGSARDLE
jgi:hypothetical protein